MHPRNPTNSHPVIASYKPHVTLPPLSQTAPAPIFLGTEPAPTPRKYDHSLLSSHGLVTALLPRNTPIPAPTMAAAIKALNAKIRSNKYSDYFCSTRTFLPGDVYQHRMAEEEEADTIGLRRIGTRERERGE
jgi:hypothetical protein